MEFDELCLAKASSEPKLEQKFDIKMKQMYFNVV